MTTASAARGRRRPVVVTAAVLLVTATVSVAALADPDLSRLLTRDEPLVRAGQWWRLVTPVLVQPDGWGQFAFNLAGIAVVGAALERRRSAWLWGIAYVAAGVGSIVILTVVRPGDHGGGASDGVAGLIGALAVTDVGRRRPPNDALAAVASAYSAFFCAYLATLDLVGPWPAMLTGDLAVAVVLTARRHAGAARTAVGVLALVAAAGVVMALRADGHGIGLLTGTGVAALAASLTGRRARVAGPPRRRAARPRSRR